MLAPQTIRRRIRPGVVLLGGVAVLILLFMAALGIGWLAAKQRVRAELARIRAAGEPVSAEDLEAFYQKPPADRDTTQLWLDAIAALDTPEFRADAEGLPFLREKNDYEPEDVLPAVDDPWPQQSAVETVLIKYHEPLQKMHRAAQVSGAARYPVNFADSFNMDFSYTNKLYAGVRLLQLEAEVAARRKDYRAVAVAVMTILVAAHTLETDPNSVSQLVKLHLDDIAEGLFERHLPDGPFSDNELLRIDRRLKTIDYVASFHRAMLGERVMTLIYFDDPERFDMEAPSPVAILFRPADELVYLQYMRKAIVAFRETGAAFLSTVSDIDREVRQLANTPLGRSRYTISLDTLTVMYTCAQARSRAIAKRDSARAAVAIERFRLRHGRIPQTLESLIPEFLPEVPLDPFDGKPLRYHVDTDEYTVYSVGMDGIDQGGQTDETQLSIPPDFVFRVRLRKPPAQE